MDLNADYVVTSHPAVLDGFIGLARNEMREQELEKGSSPGQIGPETKGLSVDGHFGTWHTAEIKEVSGESFYRMEHDEYGNTVAGIIVNADRKLVAEDLEHGFDDGAMEAITEYLYEKMPEPFIKQFYLPLFCIDCQHFILRMDVQLSGNPMRVKISSPGACLFRQFFNS